MLRNPRPVYQAVWRDNQDFDEVLISPCMIQDHMPDKVLKALEKVRWQFRYLLRYVLVTTLVLLQK